MIPTLFKVNVLLVCSLRNKLPGPRGLYNYICILEKPLCHLNSSNSVAFTGISDFSGRGTGKHCSKDTPLLTQLPLYQRLSWVIPTLQSLGLRLPGGHGLKFVMQPGIPILSDLSGWNFVTPWLSEWLYHYCCCQHSWVCKALHTARDRPGENQNSLRWDPPTPRAASHLFFSRKVEWSQC